MTIAAMLWDKGYEEGLLEARLEMNH